MENYTDLNTEDERQRVILRLQEEAALLAAEIEQRKEMESSLIERERELKEFFENAAEGIHKVAADGTIIWANKAELTLLEYSPEEYIGRNIAEFHADEHVIRDILSRLQRGETLKDYEARLRSKDGAIKHVIINSNVYWEDEKFLYTRCFTRDITERKQAEEARALLAAVVESSQDAIISKTFEGRILSWNKGAEQLFGYTPEEVIGQPITILIPLDRRDEEDMILGRIKRGERIEHFETVRMAKNGSLIDISLTISPVRDSKGVILGASKVARDITQQKRIEKELQDVMQKMQTANFAKSEFLANMSHEIRTPMNAVLGLAHILSASAPLTDQQKECVDTLKLSAQSLLSLINDVLDVSKIEGNHMELDNTPFSFFSLITELVAMFSVQAKEKGIFLKYDSAENEQFFLGDVLRIRQIITNLIGNAIKFTPQGGVTITFSITPNSAPYSAYAHIGVKDTGVGIPAEKHAAIFDKFTQADMSVTRQYGGSGLGLAISKNLAELMGGSITVKSRVGEGTEFTLHLPLEKAENMEPYSLAIPSQEVPESQAVKNKIKILLVEDHEPNILVGTLLLESMGYEYDVARNGNEALDKLKNPSHGYNAVLMDVQMPLLDGNTTTKLYREYEAATHCPRLPVIGMTAHVMEEEIKKCFESGMDDYIPKPFKPEILQQKITSSIDQAIQNLLKT